MDLQSIYAENGTSIQYHISEDWRLFLICTKTKKTEGFTWARCLSEMCMMLASSVPITEDTPDSLYCSLLNTLCETVSRPADGGLFEAYENKNCNIDCLLELRFIVDLNKLNTGTCISESLILKHP